MDFSQQLAKGYFFAKQYIIFKGFAEEIDWQDQLNITTLTEQNFLEEISWVILSGGMNEKVVKKCFPLIKSALLNFESAHTITDNKNFCYEQCIKIFNHPGKIKAILYAAEYITLNTFDWVRYRLKNEGISFISQFPYLGNATSYHFAKNIGIDVAKPDRHLIRISKTLGYSSPEDLCQEISSIIDEKVSIIDLVLWRYATLDKGYTEKLQRLMNNSFCKLRN